MLALACALSVFSGGLLSERPVPAMFRLIDTPAEFVGATVLGSRVREIEAMTLEELHEEQGRLAMVTPSLIPPAIVLGAGAAFIGAGAVMVSLVSAGEIATIGVLLVISGVATLIVGGIIMVVSAIHLGSHRRLERRVEERLRFLENHPSGSGPVTGAPPPPPPSPRATAGGALRVRALTTTGVPLAATVVELGGQRAVTDGAGMAFFEGLPAGPLSVKASAQGYASVEEAATVVLNVTSDVTLTLASTSEKLAATLKGSVRNARNGKGVAATLQLLPGDQQARCEPSGEFQFTVRGGTYTLRVSAPGFATQEKSIVVRDGDALIFNLDLAPK